MLKNIVLIFKLKAINIEKNFENTIIVLMPKTLRISKEVLISFLTSQKILILILIILFIRMTRIIIYIIIHILKVKALLLVIQVVMILNY